MTVSNTTVQVQYIADGINRQFGITFPLFSQNDLHIFVLDTEGKEREITNNFEITKEQDRVIYPTPQSGLDPLESGLRVILKRITPRMQELDLKTGGVLDAECLERGYDKAMMIMQEMDRKIEKSVKFPDASEDVPTDAKEYLDTIQNGVEQVLESAAQAADNANNAQAAATTAKECKESVENAANNVLQEAQKVTTIWQEVEKRQRKELLFKAGTPSGAYDGSLTTFDTGVDLTGVALSVFLNGQRKETPKEWSVSGTKVVFTFTLSIGASVLIEIAGLIRTAQETDVDAALLTHNANAQAHPVLEARVSALEAGGSGGGSESYVIAMSGTWTAAYLKSAHKSNFRSANLGLSGKTVTKVEVVLGSGASGSPQIIFPCLTGWGNQSGNFVDIYHQFQASAWDFSQWFEDTENIPYEIRVYYK